jgi:hypothetical protein
MTPTRPRSESASKRGNGVGVALLERGPHRKRLAVLGDQRHHSTGPSQSGQHVHDRLGRRQVHDDSLAENDVETTGGEEVEAATRVRLDELDARSDCRLDIESILGAPQHFVGGVGENDLMATLGKSQRLMSRTAPMSMTLPGGGGRWRPS